MKHLRHPSPRPGVLLSPAAFALLDPKTSTIVGEQRPFGRERVVVALPTNPGPVCLEPARVVHDNGPAYLADPDGNLIGEPAIWVSRMLTSTTTYDTRRLG